MDHSNKIIVFDTTLRDGEQAAVETFSADQKVEIARRLADMGVDVIEAGFPANVPDFPKVLAVANQVRNATICALSLCRQDSIEKAVAAIACAAKPRIHLYLGSSKVQRKTMRKPMSEQQYIDTATQAIELARRSIDDVEFTAEDGVATDPDFLVRIAQAISQAGVRTFNIPDTNGTGHPWDSRTWCSTNRPENQLGMTELFQHIARKNSDVQTGKMILSAHCHNDLGLAVANTIAAIQGGARQIEVTMNGLGEGGGNTALEEVVMALRKLQSGYFADVGHIDATRFMAISDDVNKYSGCAKAPNKPIVGKRTHVTKAGTHVAKIIKNRRAYRAVAAEEVGADPDAAIEFGSHSGQNGLGYAMGKLGYRYSNFDTPFYDYCMQCIERKRGNGSSLSAQELDDAVRDFYSLVTPIIEVPNGKRFLESKTEGDKHTVTIRVNYWKNKEKVMGEWTGISEPNQGIFQCVTKILHNHFGSFRILEVRQHSLRDSEHEVSLEGASSAATVIVRSEDCGKFIGKGVSTDLEKSTILALIDALNRTRLPLMKSDLE